GVSAVNERTDVTERRPVPGSTPGIRRAPRPVVPGAEGSRGPRIDSRLAAGNRTATGAATRAATTRAPARERRPARAGTRTPTAERPRGAAAAAQPGRPGRAAATATAPPPTRTRPGR